MSSINISRIEAERFRIIDSLLSDLKIDTTTEVISEKCEAELEKKGFKPDASERTINNDINKMRAFIKEKLAGKLNEDDEVICEVKAHYTIEGEKTEVDEPDSVANICRETIISCLTDRNNFYNKSDLLKTCNAQLEEKGLKNIGPKKLNSIMDKIKGIKEVPKCWRYTQPNFSISRFIPDTEMFANFQQLVQFLESLPSDMYDWANEAAEHIKESFHLPTVTEDLLSFDKNDNDNLKSCFPEMHTATTEKRTITIYYTSRKSSIEKEKEEEKTVSPYFLKQYGKSWQLYAKVVGSKHKYDQFSLERIVDYKDSEAPYEPTDIDFCKELKDVIGFTIPNHKHRVEHIKLLVSEGKYRFLLDAPLHHTQHLIEKSGKDYIVGIDVTPNLELEKQLLLHLDGVTVLEPAPLKEQIEDYLKTALRRYTGKDTL